MFFLLLGMWLLLSGCGNLENFLTGVLISAALSFFCSRCIGDGRRPRLSLRRLWRMAEYLCYLLLEILRSCAGVMALVWSRREVAPRLVRFRPALSHEGSCVLLANSITLTPGTISVDFEDGELCVHALDLRYAEGLEESGFVRRLQKLEVEE